MAEAGSRQTLNAQQQQKRFFGSRSRFPFAQTHNNQVTLNEPTKRAEKIGNFGVQKKQEI